MDSQSPVFPQVVSVDQSFIRRVYNWMAAGLAMSAIVSYYALLNEQFLIGFATNNFVRIGSFIGLLAIVFYLSSRIYHMGVGQATFLYFFYAGLNGLVLAPFLFLYTRASIASTFLIAASMFAVTSFYGYTTKKDLTSWGGFLTMALFGTIIASVINGFFLKSSGMDWAVSIIVVLLSIGLTAYDTQKIKRLSLGQFGDEDIETKTAIIGAFSLYLDFILMFIYLLRFFGNRR